MADGLPKVAMGNVTILIVRSCEACRLLRSPVRRPWCDLSYAGPCRLRSIG